MDYTTQNPTPRIQQALAHPGQAVASAKSEIENLTSLLKEVNQLAPHVKEVISLFKGPQTNNAPLDPHGVRSEKPVYDSFGQIVNDGPAPKKKEWSNQMNPPYSPSQPSPPYSPGPSLGAPERIVYVQKAPEPGELTEMLIMGLARLEETLGGDMPVKDVKAWVIQNKQAIIMAIQQQGKNPSNPSNSPNMSPNTP